jgi:limonene-1,2-epoxide hydrolase
VASLDAAGITNASNKKIVHWRDYMDSLAAWTALNPNYSFSAAITSSAD